MQEIKTRIERWRENEISGEQLLRDFVGHEDWMFFVAPGGVERLQCEGGAPDYIINADERGEKRLHIFSDKEACANYVKNSGVKEWRCELMASGGTALFISLPEDN